MSLRSLYIFIILFIPAILFGQPSSSEASGKAVLWQMNAEKKAEKEYAITAEGKIIKGWHVYAEDNSATGIEGLKLKFDNPSISDDKPSTLNGNITMIHDGIFDNKILKVYKDKIVLTQLITIEGPIPATLDLTIHGFAANKEEFVPIEEKMEVRLGGSDTVPFDYAQGTIGAHKRSTIDINNPIASCGDKQENSKSLLAIFLLGFGGGLIALLTPCIFPMVPVTVSYFTQPPPVSQRLATPSGGGKEQRRKGIRNAIFYGGSIFLIYVIASIPFHLIGNINPQIFNTISTNAWVNVFFFIVFILFALSFFGLFEIKLPSSFSNAAGNRSGIFFMALTLVIVSFSCTGIILGSLLVNALSANGSAWQLTAGMGGFGAALALPFGLFAMFPQWLQKLPKSGSWLDTVKKTLAFVELALAIKFLSNADLVEHWGILKREIFIGLWLLISLALSVYLFNIKWYIRYLRWNLSKTRFVFGVLSFLFAVYLIPGLTKSEYANLKLLSGFAPPLSYSIYGKANVHGKGLEPLVVNDYDKALQLARQQNKPVLIDFTGWACVNCRKMEEQVWSKSSIKDLINNNYILVSLYVDDRKKLPDGKNVGEKWAAFQEENFKQVTQPLYVLLSPDEKLLNHPVGYTPDEDKYKNWLECGIDAFKTSPVRRTAAAPSRGGRIAMK